MAFYRKVLTVVGGAALALMFAATALAQVSASRPSPGPNNSEELPVATAGGDDLTRLLTAVPLPRMAPELALRTYEKRADRQTAELGAASETMVVRAELPATKQRGEFEVKRYYQAPKGLAYAAIKFVGDNFVKTNVIARLLQSDMDHVQKGEAGDLSLSSRNYKFSFKNTEVLDGRTVHVYNVKPRKKRVGLFKGHAFIDAHTGSLVRVEGALVKSPSFFIKKVEFVQDYRDVNAYTFPAHIRSKVKTRLVGQAVIDIEHSDFRTRSISDLQQDAPSAALQRVSPQ